MTTALASNPILAALLATAQTQDKSVFGGQVFYIKHYPESTSVLVRVKTKNEKPIPGFPQGLVVDIRMHKDKHDAYATKGLAKNAAIVFMAHDIAEHQPKTASNKRGDRSLPAKRDKNTDLPIPGTETPIHRILDYVSESFTIELNAKGCTGPLVLPEQNNQDTPAAIAGEALESTVPQAEAPAPVVEGLEVPNSFPAVLAERVEG